MFKKLFKSLNKKDRYYVLFIYFLSTVVEFLIFLSPILLGRMVDGLINREFMYVGLYFLNEFLMDSIKYGRMIYDTIVFTKVKNNINFKFIDEKINDLDISTIEARTTMTSSIISFLEGTIPYFITTTYSVIGALFTIFFVDYKVALILLLSTIPFLIFTKRYKEKAIKNTRIYNNHQENKLNKINTREVNTIKDFFLRQRRLLILDSKMFANNLFANNITHSIFLLLCLITYILSNDVSVGEIMMIEIYIVRFLNVLTNSGYLLESYFNVKDTLKRI